MSKFMSALNLLPKRAVAFGTTALLAASFILPSTAHAASVPTCGAKDIKCVIAAGNPLFTERQTALQKLQTEVNTLQSKQHIDSTQANVVLNNLSTNLNDITTLKTKFDAETNANAARQDIRQLYSQYRIFAVVDPRDSREIHLDVEIDVHNKLVAIEPNLERLIAKAPSADQTKLNTLYNNYKTKLANDGTEISNAQDVLPDITVNNYDNNRSIYTASMKKLNDSTHDVNSDLHTAASDLHQMRQILKLG